MCNRQGFSLLRAPCQCPGGGARLSVGQRLERIVKGRYANLANSNKGPAWATSPDPSSPDWPTSRAIQQVSLLMSKVVSSVIAQKQDLKWETRHTRPETAKMMMNFDWIRL